MDKLIALALRSRLSNVSKNGPSVTDEEPFFVADLGQVVRQHRRWKSALPHVHPFYGKRSSPHRFFFFFFFFLVRTPVLIGASGEMQSRPNPPQAAL